MLEKLKEMITKHKAKAQEVCEALENSNQMIKDLKFMREEGKQTKKFMKELFKVKELD